MKASRLIDCGCRCGIAAPRGRHGADPPQPSEPPQKGATFESLDANGDGKISKAEAAANSDVSAQFSRYDQNGDGFIERAEVSSANQAPAGEPPKQ